MWILLSFTLVLIATSALAESPKRHHPRVVYSTNVSGVANVVPLFSNSNGSTLRRSSLSENSTAVIAAKPYSAMLQSALPNANVGWGVPAMIAATHGSQNGIVGVVVNDLPPTSVSFPTGATGFGALLPGATGNTVFGLYGEADLADHGTAVGAEIDCMNYNGDYIGGLPPFNPIGTADNICIGVQIGAGGLFRSALGLHVGGAAGGVYAAGVPQRWTDGIYVGGGGPGTSSVTRYGLFIDADSIGPSTTAVLQNHGDGINLQLGTTGPMQPLNAVIAVYDVTGNGRFSVRQNGDIYGGVFNTQDKSGVSCPAGTINLQTLEVTNGIVTHC